MKAHSFGGALSSVYQGFWQKLDVPGWRAFIFSMMALAVAFLAAVYSSVFAQQGRVIATGISASVALLLAGYVAATAVPYLARRTRIEWLHTSLDYNLTREGGAFIALILLLAVAGLNTGNNLLYLILSSLLAAILMSGILSLAVLNGVNLDIAIPEHVFARRPVEASVRLQNLKKFFPSFSLTLHSSRSGLAGQSRRQRAKPGHWRVVLGRGFQLALVALAIGLPVFFVLWGLIANFYGFRASLVARFLLLAGLLALLIAFAGLAIFSRSKWGRKKGKSSAAQAGNDVAGVHSPDLRILRQPLYFPFVPRATTLTRAVEMEFPHRGLYREESFALSTRFPFGFLEKTLRLGVSRDLLVYPAVGPTDKFFEILPMLTGELEAFQKGLGHDLYSIRDMQGSDSVRHVDWKASARTRTLKVREFAREDERRVQLILDPRIGSLPRHSSRPAGPPGAEAVAQFESAVEFCACLAWHFHEVDALMEFQCGDFHTRSARAEEIIYDVLRFLAAAEPSLEPPSVPPAASDQENVFRIICTAMPRGSVPTSLWSRSYLVFFESLPPLPSSRPGVEMANA